MHRHTLAFLLLASLLSVAACHAQQQFPTIPDSVDPNRIAVDPISGQRLFLGLFQWDVGTPIVLSGRLSHDKGYALRAWGVESPNDEIPIDPNGVYTLTFIFDEPGLYYRTLAVTDGVLTRQGTYVFEITANPGPVIELPVEVAPRLSDEVLGWIRRRQKSLQEWAKRTGLTPTLANMGTM